MPTFRFNDGEMEIPEDWENRSVIALSFPAGAKNPEASLAITRDPSANGTSLAAYVDRQLVDLAKTCPRFELVHRESLELDGTQAQRLEFKWRSPSGSVIRQLQTIVPVASGVALTITATAEDTRFEKYSAVFKKLTDQIKLSR